MNWIEVATVENWAIIGEHNRRTTAILEQIIARGIAAGEFRPGDASLAAPCQGGLHSLL
jgi:hypothetical protein